MEGKRATLNEIKAFNSLCHVPDSGAAWCRCSQSASWSSSASSIDARSSSIGNLPPFPSSLWFIELERLSSECPSSSASPMISVSTSLPATRCSEPSSVELGSTSLCNFSPSLAFPFKNILNLPHLSNQPWRVRLRAQAALPRSDQWTPNRKTGHPAIPTTSIASLLRVRYWFTVFDLVPWKLLNIVIHVEKVRQQRRTSS